MWYEGWSDRRGSWGYPPGQSSPDMIEERTDRGVRWEGQEKTWDVV